MEKKKENDRLILKSIIEDLYSDKEILKKNKYLASLFKKKVSIPVFGMLKAGKSTFLNAIIGENILPTDLAECTFSTVKIQNLMDSKPEILTTEEIQKIITQKNKEEREKKIYDGFELIVKKKFLAFNKTKEKLNESVIKSIEFIDLPGINDDFKEAQEIKKNPQDENISNYKFSKIIEKLEFDGFILVLKYNDNEIEHFFKLFKKILSESKKRYKLAEIINEKRYLIVVNQAKIDDEKFNENKKKILDTIFSNFLIPKNSNFFSKISNFFKTSSNDCSSLIYDPSDPKDFDQKSQEINVVFVDSKSESLTINDKIEEKKQDLKLSYDEEEVNDILSAYEKKLLNEKNIFDKKSNFEELVQKIHQLVEPLYLNKIKIKMEKSCSWNLENNLLMEWEKQLNNFANDFAQVFGVFLEINKGLQKFYQKESSIVLPSLLSLQDKFNAVLDDFISFLSKKIKIPINFQLNEMASNLRKNRPIPKILSLFFPEIHEDITHLSLWLSFIMGIMDNIDPSILNSLIQDIETDFHEEVFSFIAYNRCLIHLIKINKKN